MIGLKSSPNGRYGLFVENERRFWLCYAPNGNCYRFDGDVCVCDLDESGHDPGDEDRS